MAFHYRNLLILLATVAATGVGCASDEPSELGRASQDDLNVYEKSNGKFYQGLSYGPSALEAEGYHTLAGAAKSASAVIVAEVVGVRHTGTIVEKDVSPEGHIHALGIDLRPVEVIVGNLPEQYHDRLTVERGGFSGEPSEMVERMQAALPDGLSVWFLRTQAEYTEQMKGRPPTEEEKEGPDYRLVCSQGLFVQGAQHVVNPIEEDNFGMVEGEAYEKLGQLVQTLRGVEGWHGRAPG